jgi:beta-lactam-binding protein with PASTA domain
LGIVSTGNAKGNQGTIYLQNPHEGTWVRIGSKVDVEIVEPPKTPGPGDQTIWVFVPDLSGRRQKAADETLRQHGLVLGSVSLEAATVEVALFSLNLHVPT